MLKRNFLKILLVITVFFSFFWLILHYYNLENYKFNFDKSIIPIIEADKKPYRISPPKKNENDDPLQNSCTLNDEC